MTPVDRQTAQRILAKTRDEKTVLHFTVNGVEQTKTLNRVEGSLLNNRLALRGTVAFTDVELESSEDIFKSGRATIFGQEFTLDRRNIKNAERPYVYALTYYLDIET